MLIYVEISWGPIEIIKFNILAFISVSTERRKKNQARFGSVFETIRLGSAR